ncbi:MAG TPA: phytanoyl-CoA dioxygenase family protein [Verrucomicrobiae bacterium]|nr:phytanoyl-CoA dioxygenase family protein [Verrucomicrobiae bacterium]
MTTALKTARLGAGHVMEYRRDGYLIFREPVFSGQKFRALQEHFEEKLAVLPADVRPESMDAPHFTDTKLFEWLFSNEVLDLVEPIIGPDIALWSSHFICKPRGTGKRVPWHEDSAYWRGQLEPMEVVTVWLAIDPSTRQNGGMCVIPRTHRTGKQGQSDYEAVADQEKSVFTHEIVKPQRDESRAEAIELQPNQCSLHDGRLIHGSPANTSSLRRCGYTMRYMPTAVKFHAEGCRSYHQIYLARGCDRAGNEYADSTRTYPEMARYREVNKKTGH